MEESNTEKMYRYGAMYSIVMNKIQNLLAKEIDLQAKDSILPELENKNKDMGPRDFIGDTVTYDECGQIIWGKKGGDMQKLLDIRGWGAIQQLFKKEGDAAKFQDDLGAWFAEAINEKLEREI